MINRDGVGSATQPSAKPSISAGTERKPGASSPTSSAIATQSLVEQFLEAVAVKPQLPDPDDLEPDIDVGGNALALAQFDDALQLQRLRDAAIRQRDPGAQRGARYERPRQFGSHRDIQRAKVKRCCARSRRGAAPSGGSAPAEIER